MTVSRHQPVYSDAERSLNELGRLAAGNSTTSFSRVQELLDAILDRGTRLVLFLGAGCSRTVRLLDGPPGYADYAGKSWTQLMSALIDEAAPGTREAFFAKFLQSGEECQAKPTLHSLLLTADKLQVASFITASFNNTNLRDEAISRAVHIPDECGRRESRLYEALMRLPFADIVTTNYDTNVEWFLHDSSRAANARVVGVTDRSSLTASFSSKPDVRIFYLHGKAGASKLIFDRFDYARLISERDGIFDYVTQLLRGATILYVGFGLNDQSFNLIDDRLFYLDGDRRPLSFAFVKRAAEDEHRTWASRQIRLIQFDQYQRLPEIIEHINVIRDFVNWAEPKRPRHILLNEDRTRGYLTDAMNEYAEGRYRRSLEQSRAALASSLFWQRQRGDDGTRDLPQDRAQHLCHIRLRLALSHYKLRLTDDARANAESHYTLVVLNVDEAERIIRRHVGSNGDQWTAFQTSAQLLRAKLAYNEGRYTDALTMYSEAIESLESLVCEPEMIPSSVADLIRCLRTAELFYYAVCQQSRLHYQLLDAAPEDPRAYRTSQRERLAAVAGRIELLVRRVDVSIDSDAYQQAEIKYLTASLRRIADIARWTAGRNGVNVFHGAIPWRQECTREQLIDLDEAIVLLRQIGGFNGHEKSSEWVAQRYRYLARAHGLRWLVTQETESRMPAGDDLREAYEILQLAFQSSRGPGTEREVIVNLLEAARLNVLALFGERRFGGRELSPLTISAGLHYLDAAFGEIFGRFKDRPGVHLAWFEALGSSLAAYYALGVSGVAPYEGPKAKNANLKSLLASSPEQRRDRVVAMYERCGDCAGRVALFIKSYDEIYRECKGWSSDGRRVRRAAMSERRKRLRRRLGAEVVIAGRRGRLIDVTPLGFMAEFAHPGELPGTFEVQTLKLEPLANATLVWQDRPEDPPGPQRCGGRIDSDIGDRWRLFVDAVVGAGDAR